MFSFSEIGNLCSHPPRQPLVYGCFPVDNYLSIMKDAQEQIRAGVFIPLFQIECSKCKLKIIKEEFRQHEKNCQKKRTSQVLRSEKKECCPLAYNSKKCDACDKMSEMGETNEVEEEEHEDDPTALSKIFACPLLCGGKFLTKSLVKNHLQKFHRVSIKAQLALGLNITQIDLKTIDGCQE